ncbi:MAG: hypothetical protein A2W31_09355 [Planctomycetes bacterium RBG_16_64_10]|nr:MAG: hypothetical protein A2W31_09355 [Planctomycetes bacterium RBG_16_64_10]
MQAIIRMARSGLFVVLIVSYAAAQERGIQYEGALPWYQDLVTAQRIAADSNRLVLVHFWAPWCEPCLRLEQQVLSQPGVAAWIQRNYVPVKLNVDQFGELAHGYGVQGLPTDVVLTPAGQVLARVKSPLSAPAYVEQLAQIAAAQRSRSEPLQANRGVADAGPIPPAGAVSAPLQDPYYAGGTASPMAVPPAGNPYATFGTPVAGQSWAADQAAGPPPIGTNYAPAGVAAPPRQGATMGYATGYPGYPGQSPVWPGANVPGHPTSVTWPSNQAAPSRAVAGPGTGYGAAPPSQASMAQGGSVPVAGNPAAAEAVGSRYQDVWRAASGPSAVGGQRTGQVDPGWQPATPQSNAGPSPAVGSDPSAAPPAATGAQTSVPPLGMDGFCPVTLKKQQRWTLGDRRWGVIHRGRTYLFASAEAQREFLQDPDLYSPVLSGIDPVVALEQGRSMAGRRRHGVFYGGRVYLFASESSLQRFSRSPEQYANGVHQVMQQGADHIGPR